MTHSLHTSIPEFPLGQVLLQAQSRIESWFRAQWLKTPAPFYASVDLRNAGSKMAPVDTNLFPAGFNNLSPATASLCVHAIQSAMERLMPDAVRVLLIPENHTRNQFYLESITTLRDLVETAGYEVRVGSLIDGLDQPTDFALPSGRTLTLEPLTRRGEEVGAGDYFPCCILLNNDLSSGIPELLQGISQTIIPQPYLGWSNRLKSDHFAHYADVVADFAAHIDIDPWLLEPGFRKCGDINFMQREGEACLSKHVANLLQEIRSNYAKYGITDEPYVVIKADAGTHGMAVMTVQHEDQVHELNRKQRTRMSSTKGGQTVESVIVQEGIHTRETWGENESSAEPVIYMIDHFVVGGFFRIHAQRESNENLNAPGMHFAPLPFEDPCSTPDKELPADAAPNRLYAYGVVARLALLAAAREIVDGD